jgi:hypothetical protein
MRLIRNTLPIFFTSLLIACGGSSEEAEVIQEELITANTNNTTTTDITNMLLTLTEGTCLSYIGEYRSQVTDIQRAIDFNGSVVVTQEGNECVFTVNEIPNHDFNDISAAFATNTSTQQGSYRISSNPTFASNSSILSLHTTNAVMLNGVLLDILPAACYGVGNEPLGQEKIGCGTEQIDNPWRYDPMSPYNDFGTDTHNAHTQPDGTYHYHGNPMALFEQDCDILAQTSPVIGFAADGFPIYGSCFSDNGDTQKAQSSYRLKQGGRVTVEGYQTPQAGIGLINSDNYDGQFRGDYEYVEGLGDLDKCNGKSINGQYGYYVTNTYPWVMACFMGTPNNTLRKTANALDNRQHGH